jgi:multiple sugar transport system ATP-binding protein
MTAQIELKNVEKYYGAYHALKNIDLSIAKGQFVALVGPSGCGKSTLLRSLAGLETITSGAIHIAGERVNDLPPRKRDVAMVFQSYALYPHMNVMDNLTYSMRLKRKPRAEIEAAAKEVAETIGLSHLLDRFPRELSGGQRQRVAMGRAIIRNPKAFLFDEPLSNLDASLRVHMRKEVRALHNRLGATSVYVTHDQIEAMTMADHVVVMRDGIIEQQGAPLDLYAHPANQFVAGFIGSPAMNFVDARISESGEAARLNLPGEPLIPLNGSYPPGRSVIIGLRPEHLSVVGPDAGLALKVSMVESVGSASYISCSATPELSFVVEGTTRLRSGDSVQLAIDPDHVHVFDAKTRLAIGVVN